MSVEASRQFGRDYLQIDAIEALEALGIDMFIKHFGEAGIIKAMNSGDVLEIIGRKDAISYFDITEAES